MSGMEKIFIEAMNCSDIYVEISDSWKMKNPQTIIRYKSDK
jgi:hypothetical protein